MSGVGISGQVLYIYNQTSGLGWLCCFVPPLWLKPLLIALKFNYVTHTEGSLAL